ncbi:MAG: hypothetical protein EBU04_11215, partial [Verrucomicrobia bacterium]|nr:hypothetical protein [Verrucomicrobiota bacterium]
LTPLRVEYVQFGTNSAIVLAYKGPKDKDTQWLSKTKGGKAGKPAKEKVFIPIQPKDGVAAIYRNFIDKITPRAIGIGFPNGLNIAYSADNLAAELFWNGKFMDGGHHWTDRGAGNEPPSATSARRRRMTRNGSSLRSTSRPSSRATTSTRRVTRPSAPRAKALHSATPGCRKNILERPRSRARSR